jgi:dTDP-4-amino-4,6-dideoxygalactose transaminase
MINLFSPFVPKEAIEEVGEVLRTRFIGQGPKVDLFEKEFCKFFNVKNATAVNSGTSALETAYDLINLKAGDEVISTPLTCTATNLPLVRRGVKIIWADIDPNTLCINPQDVYNKLSQKTKAVIQVHLGGIEAQVEDLSFANYGYIPRISDACQALGIFEGDYTCISFQAIKHITTIDGGMIICPNAKEARDAKLWRWFGIDREKKVANNWQSYTERQMTFDIELPGAKRHMTDVSAVMGLVGLKYYEKGIEYRKKLFDLYKENLKDIDGIKIIDGPKNVYWLFTILVERRDDFAKKMFEADIDTNMVQIRNDIYKVFGGKKADLPILNSIESKYLSLPIGMHISEDDVNYITSTIRKGW